MPSNSPRTFRAALFISLSMPCALPIVDFRALRVGVVRGAPGLSARRPSLIDGECMGM